MLGVYWQKLGEAGAGAYSFLRENLAGTLPLAAGLPLIPLRDGRLLLVGLIGAIAVGLGRSGHQAGAGAILMVVLGTAGVLLLAESALIYSTFRGLYHVPLLTVLVVGTLRLWQVVADRIVLFLTRARGIDVGRRADRSQRVVASIAAAALAAGGLVLTTLHVRTVLRAGSSQPDVQEMSLFDARSGAALPLGEVAWREVVKSEHVFWTAELVKKPRCAAIAVSGLPTVLAGAYRVGILDAGTSRWVSEAMPAEGVALLNAANLRDGERLRIVISGANQERERLIVRPGRLVVEQQILKETVQLNSLALGLACLAVAVAMFVTGWRDIAVGQDGEIDDGLAGARGGQR